MNTKPDGQDEKGKKSLVRRRKSIKHARRVKNRTTTNPNSYAMKVIRKKKSISPVVDPVATLRKQIQSGSLDTMTLEEILASPSLSPKGSKPSVLDVFGKLEGNGGRKLETSEMGDRKDEITFLFKETKRVRLLKDRSMKLRWRLSVDLHPLSKTETGSSLSSKPKPRRVKSEPAIPSWDYISWHSGVSERQKEKGDSDSEQESLAIEDEHERSMRAVIERIGARDQYLVAGIDSDGEETTDLSEKDSPHCHEENEGSGIGHPCEKETLPQLPKEDKDNPVEGSHYRNPSLSATQKLKTEPNLLRVENGLSFLERTWLAFGRKDIVGGSLHGLLNYFVRSQEEEFQIEFLSTLHFWCPKGHLIDLVVDCYQKGNVNFPLGSEHSILLERNEFSKFESKTEESPIEFSDSSQDFPRSCFDSIGNNSFQLERNMSDKEPCAEQPKDKEHKRHLTTSVNLPRKGLNMTYGPILLPGLGTIQDHRKNISSYEKFTEPGLLIPSIGIPIVTVPEWGVSPRLMTSHPQKPHLSDSAGHTIPPPPRPPPPPPPPPFHGRKPSPVRPKRAPPPIPIVTILGGKNSSVSSPRSLESLGASSPDRQPAFRGRSNPVTPRDPSMTFPRMLTGKKRTEAGTELKIPEKSVLKSTENRKMGDSYENHSSRNPLMKSKSHGSVIKRLAKDSILKTANTELDEKLEDEDETDEINTILDQKKGKKKEKKREKEIEKDKGDKKDRVKEKVPPNQTTKRQRTSITEKEKEPPHSARGRAVEKKPEVKNSQEPSSEAIRNIFETTACVSSFTIHINKQTKTLIFQPSKKVIDVLKPVCNVRGINLDDHYIKGTDGTLLFINEETTLGDLSVRDIRLEPKEPTGEEMDSDMELEETNSQLDIKDSVKRLAEKGVGFVSLLQEEGLSTEELHPDQKGLIKLIHDWIDFNVHDFNKDPVKYKFQKFLSLLEYDHGEAINSLLRKKMAGIRKDNFHILVGEMVISDPNKLYKKPFEGQVILDWLRINKKLRIKPDCLDICKSLIQHRLLKRDGKEKDEKSETIFIASTFPTQKFRFFISHKRLLDAKICQLALEAARKPSEKEFMDFPIRIFAKQLTYFEWMLFKRVELREINFWLKGDKEQRGKYAPNLLNLTNFVNRVSLWVTTEIVMCANLKRRQSLIKKFINVASQCFSCKNYGGGLEIVMGLKHAAIQRMKRSWKIPQKYLLMFQTMAEVVSPENNWEHWRKLLKEHDNTGPYVPYIGLFLSDLTFIKDGGGDTVEVPPQYGVHFGWDKNSKMAGLLCKIKYLQSQELEEDIVPEMIYQFYFAREMFVLGENEIFQKSRLMEPTKVIGTHVNGLDV